jgi:recombination protein RecA
MPSAATLRLHIETALSQRIPSALTPVARIIRPVVSCGIAPVDDLLRGGLPSGAVTEVAGPECSGRTAFALSFLAQITAEGRVCAWIDVSDTLHPESAVAAGVDLSRLLWVRCGVLHTTPRTSSANTFALPEKYLIPAAGKRGLHGGGFGPHPRTEMNGLSDAVGGLLQGEAIAPRCAEPQRRKYPAHETVEPVSPQVFQRLDKSVIPGPLARIDQALRVTDLLLQGGGFSALVLDLGSITPEYASRVPLATWFRYRAAAERTQASILMLTQHPCAKSSAGLVLRMQAGDPLRDESTVFTGIEHRIEIERERFGPAPGNVVPLRKPPQSERQTTWRSRTAWAGRQ